MHLEHEATLRACAAEPATATATDVVTMAVPLPSMPTIVQAPAVVPATAQVGGLPFAFMSTLDRPHVVLATAPSDAWASGAPRLLEETPGGAVIRRDIDLAALPTDLAALIGRNMHAFSASGRVCTGVLGAPYMVSELDGELRYMVMDAEPEQNPPLDPAKLWTEGRRTLVAELVSTQDCSDALWARDVTLPEPIVYTAQSDDEIPVAAARRAIVALPEFSALAREFATFVASFQDDSFTTRRLVDRLRPRAWRNPDGTSELAVYTLDGDEFGGCGGFANSWAAAIVEGRSVRHAFLDEADDVVIAVVDLDRDGLPEILTEDWMTATRLVAPRIRADRGEVGFTVKSFAGQSAESAVVTTLETVPFFGCPC